MRVSNVRNQVLILWSGALWSVGCEYMPHTICFVVSESAEREQNVTS